MNLSLPGSPRQSAGDLLGRGLCCLRSVPLFVSLLSKPLPNPFLWGTVRSALVSQVEARRGRCRLRLDRAVCVCPRGRDTLLPAAPWPLELFWVLGLPHAAQAGTQSCLRGGDRHAVSGRAGVRPHGGRSPTITQPGVGPFLFPKIKREHVGWERCLYKGHRAGEDWHARVSADG